MAKKIVIRPANSNTPLPKQDEKKIVLGNRNSTPSKPRAWNQGLFTKLPKNALRIILAGVVLFMAILLVSKAINRNNPDDFPPTPKPAPVPPSPPTPEALLKFNPQHYGVQDQTPNTTNLSVKEWLEPLKINRGFQDDLIHEAKKIGVDTIYKAHSLKVYQDTVSKKFVYGVYQKVDLQFVVFQFAPFPEVRVVDLPVKYREASASGVLRDSQLLFMLLVQEVGFDIAQQAEEAMRHSVDFYHMENGDEYKLFFEEKTVFDTVIARGPLKAISIKTNGNTYYGIRCNTQNGPIYLDENAKSLEKNFLLAPLKNVRISSRYNLTRLHPVDNEIRPHLGTDYAAPEGTEIFSVADGQVIEASYKKFNGNYIKIRHENPYMTQYLHMQRYAPGIGVGSRVKMGQVIGFVGQTGEKITGPHVCFRFWKNNVQVDHLKEHFKPLAQLNMQEEDESQQTCENFKRRLDNLPLKRGVLF